MQYGSLQNLAIWQKAMLLAKHTYQILKDFLTEERYGLIDQIRRCAISVPSNIAEGYGRMSDNEFLRFLAIANGSLYELETQILLTSEILPALSDKCASILEEITEEKKIIRSFIATIKNRIR